MKSKSLPTKRRPVNKGVFRKLNAVTQGRRRKQRASTTANARDFEDGQGSARIGRALFVILLIHLLAVAMIFVHHRFLSDRPAEEATAPVHQKPVKEQAAPLVGPAPSSGVVRADVSPSDAPYIVSRGDTYASVAAAHQIAEADLRRINGNSAIRPGLLLKIPVKRVVVQAPQAEHASEPVLIQANRAAAEPQATPPAAIPVRDQGLVDAIDTRNAPRATPVSTDGKYVVRKGDTVWGIANRHGVDQAKLKEINGITDPRKLRVGMALKIP